MLPGFLLDQHTAGKQQMGLASYLNPDIKQ
jgi:hypothetical protein